MATVDQLKTALKECTDAVEHLRRVHREFCKERKVMLTAGMPSATELLIEVNRMLLIRSDPNNDDTTDKKGDST